MITNKKDSFIIFKQYLELCWKYNPNKESEYTKFKNRNLNKKSENKKKTKNKLFRFRSSLNGENRKLNQHQLTLLL